MQISAWDMLIFLFLFEWGNVDMLIFCHISFILSCFKYFFYSKTSMHKKIIIDDCDPSQQCWYQRSNNHFQKIKNIVKIYQTKKLSHHKF